MKDEAKAALAILALTASAFMVGYLVGLVH
jgi:hypothetical protein